VEAGSMKNYVAIGSGISKKIAKHRWKRDFCKYSLPNRSWIGDLALEGRQAHHEYR